MATRRPGVGRRHKSKTMPASKKSLVSWVAAALFGAVCGAHGALSTDPPERQTFSLNVMPSANLAVRRALLTQLADLAEPEALTLKGNEPLEVWVRRRCGFATDDLLTIVRRFNPGLGDSVADTDRPLTMPACPFWEFNKPVVAVRGGRSGALALIGENMGYAGPKNQSLFLTSNPELQSLDAVRSGQKVILPYVVQPITIPLRATLPNAPASARRFAERFANLLIGRAGPLEVDLVKNVSTGEGTADVPCPYWELPPDTWPFDRAAVVEVLKDFIDSGRGTWAGPVTIVVADTGIDRKDVARLSLHDNAGERGRKEDNGKDDDGDKFVDNRYGANVDQQGAAGGFPQSDANYARAEHGIEVAALALGGLPGDQLDTVIRSKLRVSIANLVRRYEFRPADYRISQTGLTASMLLARKLKAGVLNWSVASRSPMVSLEEALRQDDLPLIVVAAGNDGLPLDKLGGFPAAYVRGFDSRMIVVGAHSPRDRRGELIEWSNWGAETVDLLGPGCRVRTLGHDAHKLVDGTSFAAPLVSFTAALLQAQGIDQPIQIKSRIMSTVDLNPALEPLVRSAGSLNIAKALAIHRDVVEMVDDGTAKMHLGDLQWPTEVLSVCDTTVPVDSLLRLAPHFMPTSKEPMLVEWFEFEEGSGRLLKIRRQRCAAEDLEFSFQAVGATMSRPLRLGQVHDIVPRRQ